MPKINLLTSEIYNKISAGEVVENPASVVKELIENSIDAGAARIDVSVIDGGLTYISVSDDGCGIDKNDLKTAFMPHATSKISDENDLFNIATLGFRGEALPSIASVANVKIKSKYIDSDVAYELSVSDGKFSELSETYLDCGTTIEVHKLFSNVPARLKFMKKPKSEEANVTHVVEKLILSHPEIEFTYSADNKVVYKTNGGGLEDAFYVIYGKNAYDNRIPVDFANEYGLRIRGFICSEAYTKSNRNSQTIIINSRSISDAAISASIQNAYGERLMKRNFPVFVLSIVIPFDQVDVNVHPAKAEVRFKNSRMVCGFVYEAVKQTLLQRDIQRAISFGAFNTDVDEVIDNNIDPDFSNQFFGSATEAAARERAIQNELNLWKNDPPISEECMEIERLAREELAKENTANKVYTGIPPEEIPYRETCAPLPPEEEQVVYINDDLGLSLLGQAYEAINNNAPSVFGEGKQIIFSFNDDENELNPNEVPLIDYKILGQFAECYLIVEAKQQLFIIDQHAAHERFIYDKLMQQIDSGENYSQRLLVPVTINLSSADFVKFYSLIDELNEIGFEVEEFGNCCIKISALPTALLKMNVKKFVDELLALDIFDKKISVSTILREKIIQTSCKTAIKAGDVLNDKQIQTVVDNALTLKHGYTCPHGRPIILTFTLEQIEKMFKRIV